MKESAGASERACAGRLREALDALEIMQNEKCVLEVGPAALVRLCEVAASFPPFGLPAADLEASIGRTHMLLHEVNRTPLGV